MVEAGRADVGHMLFEAEVSRKNHPKHSNMLTRCDDGRSELQGWKAVIPHREGVPRTSPKQLGLVHVKFQPISRHPVVNVHDALLKSSDGRRHVITTTVQVQLCVVCK